MVLPGETEEFFLDSFHFLSNLEISNIRVKYFIAKSQAPAYSIIEGLVSKEEKLKRREIIKELSDKKQFAFYKSQLGITHDVLFERDNINGCIHGYTENNVRVKTGWDPLLVNTIHKVKLLEIDKEGIVLFDFVKENILEKNLSAI
ncbi:MAG: hypothetical protein JKY02_03440 [Flavobacteriaceae bacterium]|nr:hypothetical protein [Flavobacteriaceae bacterium]